MSAPALSIPVRANLDAFKKSMNETSSLARTATKNVLDRFAEMNKGLAISGAAAGAGWALGWVGRIALVAGSFKLMGDAISVTRQQLADMVTIADKAQNLGVSPQFFQSFLTEAQKLKVGADELESALSNAFQATKDKSPIDINQWDTGEEKITSVEKALRVYNATLAKAAGTKLDGLVLFRDADTQEKKINAVLAAMIQLKSIGQQAAALDLGEKMFGAQFVDRIRQGKTSAESLLASMKAAAADADSIFPNDLVLRAKAIDEQLKLSEDRLSRALKPAFNDLAATMLTIKGYWADVVGLISQAVEFTNKLGITSETARKKSELASINDAIKNGTGLGGAPQVTNIPGVSGIYDALGAEKPQDALKRRRDKLQAEIDAAERGAPEGPELPKPSRGTGGAPTKKATGSETDKFDTSAESIEKRTAALVGEAAAVDLGTAAREKSKITAQLETVAKQANAAAGKGENVITAEQRDTINEVATAYSNAAGALEKAKVASNIKFDKSTAFLTQEDVAIASQLRGIYPDVATALSSVEAAGMRAANGMRELSNVGQEVNRGMFVEFGQNLRNGMSAWDAFKNAGVNALGKIADKLMSMAADNLWKAAFGGSTGGGGLLGLLGIGGGASYGPITLGSAAGPTPFADGGYTGPGGKNQPKGIVHAGEVVWSQSDVARAGGVGTVEAMRRGVRGYADGGTVGLPSAPSAPATAAPAAPQKIKIDVGVSVDQNGNLQGYVKKVSQDASQQAVVGFVKSPQFVDHVAGASKRASSSRKL